MSRIKSFFFRVLVLVWAVVVRVTTGKWPDGVGHVGR
jgi:hypothetical protein